MSDEHEEPAKRPNRRVWAVWLLMLYVLSIGPVGGTFAKLVRSGQMPDAVAMFVVPIYVVVYAPLFYVAEKIPVLQNMLQRYGDLFR